MPVRFKLALLVAALSALLLVLVVGRLAARTNHQQPAGTFVGSLQPSNAVAPNFQLRDQDGKIVRLDQYRGKVLILTFLYSSCDDTCPLIADQIRAALDQLPKPVPVLAVSVDPKHDSPQRAKQFLVEHKLTGRMRFLLGSQDQLQPIWRSYGIQPQGDGFEHSAYVLLIDATGKRRVSFSSSLLTPDGLAHDLQALSVT